MQNCKKEPRLEDANFPLNFLLGEGLGEAKLVQQILIDQLRPINPSVLHYRVDHLYVGYRGLIKTAYLARESLDEVGKEVAEFRAHSSTLHDRYNI